jgi:hypothetical protein
MPVLPFFSIRFPIPDRVNYQCLKCLIPVTAMAIPWALQ